MASVFRPGDRCGPYEVVRQLGEGGMGEVHLVRNAAGELRALKVLSPSAQQNREIVKRFMGEIQVLSYLEHAHVVRFFEAGMMDRDGASVLWLALEYLQGRTLREIIETQPGTLSEDSILRWGRQVAQGVNEAHKLKVVHRDLKPENVVIVADDMAKVIDFGIAKFRDWGDTRSRTSGAKVGTVLYMAPEQLDDALGVPIDERVDVYGLGVILYELALGRNPYVAEGRSPDMASLLIGKLTQDLPPVRTMAPRLSPELGEVIDRACQHDAARRYSNMSEVHDALSAVWRRHMDERRGRMLGEAAPPAPRASNPPTPVEATALPAPPVGQSSRFESVRTLPGVEVPREVRGHLRNVALFGAVVGVASGLVLFRAVLEPRLRVATQTQRQASTAAPERSAAPSDAQETTPQATREIAAAGQGSSRLVSSAAPPSPPASPDASTPNRSGEPQRRAVASAPAPSPQPLRTPTPAPAPAHPQSVLLHPSPR